MSSRALASLLGLAVCLACPAAGDGTARRGAKLTSEAEAIDGKDQAPKLDEPHTRAPPVDAPLVDATPTELRAPTKAEALAASRARIDRKLAELAPIVALGPRRHALALRVLDPKHPLAADVVIVVLEGSELDGAISWSVIAEASVHHLESNDYGPDEAPPALPTTFEAEDYDDDGELELLIRMREDLMCGGGGVNTITTMALLDIEPALSVAMKTELHHEMGAAPVATRAKTTFEDLDGDGHRDLRIRYTTKDEDEGTKKVAENRWLWSASVDRWELQPGLSLDSVPAYDSWGCDW